VLQLGHTGVKRQARDARYLSNEASAVRRKTSAQDKSKSSSATGCNEGGAPRRRPKPWRCVFLADAL
jgi:hypothetical protein